MRNYGPCMCGATDCPSCGPAQGYEVRRIWRKGRWQYVNPEDLTEEEALRADADDYPEPEDRNKV